MRSAISTIIRNLLCLVVTYVLPIPARLGVCECFVEDVSSPFAGWFAALDKTAAAEITVVLACVEQRNLPTSKAFGREHRLDFGLGYRVHFVRDSSALVILLAGGTKNR